MNIKSIGIMAATAIALTSCHSNPFLKEWNTPYGIPPFDKIEISDYIPAIKAGIEKQNKEIEDIVNCPDAPDFQNTIAALDRSGLMLEHVTGVLYNVAESDFSDKLNEVVEEATTILSDHSDNIYMNPALFARVKAVYDSHPEGLTGEQQMLLDETYKAFLRNGVGLDEASQARLREINAELAGLALSFGNNLLAESNSFEKELGFSVAMYYDRMAAEPDRALREKIFRMYSNRGNNGNEYDNNSNVLKIMQLRIEKAKMFGYPTPAAQILDNTMAKDPAVVDSFLTEIMDAASARIKVEVADMQKLMDEDIKAGLLPEGSTIQPWDYMYYAEKVRKARFDFDESEAMQYFKMENVREGVFGNASRMYGLQFEPIKGVALYNPEAEAFRVSDADGTFMGILITDYYPRESKRGGAWMNNFVNQYRDDEGNDIRPVIVNVGNFNKPDGDKPSLLTIDQVQTMFHEFGHALHGMLSQCTYRSLSGTNVKRDFVELPSQINENWAFCKEVLPTYAKHWKTGEVIPDSLVTKIQETATFNQGFVTGELCAASILDMKWHELSSIDGINVEDFQNKVCEDMGLPKEIIPRYLSTYFNHVFGGSGYSAGYYSYLWAEVLDKDAFELFKQKGVLDHETSMSFRKNILEKGGTEEPMVLYRNFRGADPDAGALLRARGLAE